MKAARRATSEDDDTDFADEVDEEEKWSHRKRVYASVWTQLKPLLFWIGDTLDLDENGKVKLIEDGNVDGKEVSSGDSTDEPEKEDGKESKESDKAPS